MKTLQQFIKEQMVCELSSDLLYRSEKTAREKAKQTKGHERRHRLSQAETFAKGAKKAVKAELDEETAKSQEIVNLIKEFNNNFVDIIGNIKSLGGIMPKLSVNTIMNNDNIECYKDFGTYLVRVNFDVKDFEGKHIKGFLEGMRYPDIFVWNNDENDELNNAFISTQDGKNYGLPAGDGCRMDDETAKIYSNFIDKVLDVKYDYTDYFTGK